MRLLTAGSLVRVQQGEPRRSKVRFAPILFSGKTKPSARCLAPPRFTKNARRFLRERQRDQRHCGSAVGPKPTAAGGGGRRRALSKREKCERKRAERPFCKLDESRKKRGDGKPTAAGGGGRRRALSKREDFDREGERRPFCKLDRWFESNRGSHERNRLCLPDKSGFFSTKSIFDG